MTPSITPVKTRFAPSPTGYLHVGGARTALYSWLFARHCGGQFILRIEDTDRERSTQPAINAILESLQWLGLTWDEGPYYQSERLARYRTVVEQLVATGSAYRCYCSRERLEALREQQWARGEKPRYDGHCRDTDTPRKPADDAPYVVRFRNPQQGAVSFEDQIRGLITISNGELDDLILCRSDHTPTYNFCVVIDDWDMGITHVIRGEDHINNTPRQINLLHALGAPIPQYAHLPMVLGQDGKKLSKRHGVVSVLQYRDHGYLPEALLNHLLRLGWSHGDQEIFSLEAMQLYFSLAAVNRSAAVFDPTKLSWLNQHYLTHLPAARVAEQLAWQLHQQSIDTTAGPALTEIVPLLAPRCQRLDAMAQASHYFFGDTVYFEATAAKKYLTPQAQPPLIALYDGLAALPATPMGWQADAIRQILHQLTDTLSLSLGKIGMPLRVAVTGGTQSPAIERVLEILGKTRTLARIEQALAYMAAQEQAGGSADQSLEPE